MQDFVSALPYGRKTIRDEVYKLKARFGWLHIDCIDIVKFIELVLPRIDDEFYLDVVSNRYFKDRYAETCPEEHVIRVAKHIYEKARKGDPFCRLIMAHELGHYIMHANRNICFARSINKSCSIERQADIFSTEFLISYDFAKKHTASEISKTCGVPYIEASKYKKYILKENKSRKHSTKNKAKRKAKSHSKRFGER